MTASGSSLTRVLRMLMDLWVFLIVLVFVLLRNLLRDVERGTPFTPINGKRIRMLGVLFLVVGVLAPAIEFAAAYLVLSNAVTSSPDLSPHLNFTTDVIFAGLLLLVLSQVWIRGSELEEDQALTV